MDKLFHIGIKVRCFNFSTFPLLVLFHYFCSPFIVQFLLFSFQGENLAHMLARSVQSEVDSYAVDMRHHSVVVSTN